MPHRGGTAPAPICSTASGFAARVGGSTPASNCARAHEMFVASGMEAFADRARGELQASGEKVRRRTVETRDDLTAQERQIARLARDGLSNPEIAARLFLSARTVEWHLHNVFVKLNIKSRRDLENALASFDSAVQP